MGPAVPRVSVARETPVSQMAPEATRAPAEVVRERSVPRPVRPRGSRRRHVLPSRAQLPCQGLADTLCRDPVGTAGPQPEGRGAGRCSCILFAEWRVAGAMGLEEATGWGAEGRGFSLGVQGKEGRGDRGTGGTGPGGGGADGPGVAGRGGGERRPDGPGRRGADLRGWRGGRVAVGKAGLGVVRTPEAPTRSVFDDALTEWLPATSPCLSRHPRRHRWPTSVWRHRASPRSGQFGRSSRYSATS